MSARSSAPVLPTEDEVVLLRTSERKSYKTCRQQWWWSFIDGLESIDTGPALRFGTLVHQSLAGWYIPGRKRGIHPARTFEKLYKLELEAGLREFSVRLDDDPKWADALDLGIAVLKHYVEHYGRDDDINVIAPEFPFELHIYDKRGRYLVTYVGQFDLVFMDMKTTQVGLIETKTASSIGTAYLSLDEQAGSYWAFAPEVLQSTGALRPGQDIDFIMYNFLRKAAPDTRPRDEEGHYLNQDGSVSKKQPPPYFVRKRIYRDTADRRNLIERVRREAWEMKQVRAGKLPVYKNPSLTYPDQHCAGCEFRDMCEIHEAGGDWQRYRDATMKKWDPYAEHRDPILEEA